MTDWVLIALIVAAAALSVIGLVLAGYSIALRLRSHRDAAQRELAYSRFDADIRHGLATSGIPEPSTLAGKDALYFVDLVFQYAQPQEGAARARCRELVAPYLPALARRLETGDNGQKMRCIGTLAVLAPTAFGGALAKSLDDPSPRVALAAAQVLARHGALEQRYVVLDRLDRFVGIDRAYLAAVVIAMGAEVAPKLREFMERTDQPEVIRVVACDALGQMNDFSAADGAVRVLAATKDRELLAAALRLLERVGQLRHAAVVRQLAVHADEVVRIHAIGALGSIGEASDASLLATALDDRSDWVALRAARSLRRLGSNDVLARLAGMTTPRSDAAKEVLAEETPR